MGIRKFNLPLLTSYILLSLLMSNQLFAYRGDPQPVNPVEYADIRFEAPPEKMGYIEARDSKTNELLWEKQIYTIEYDPDVEPDLQWIFITSLEIKEDKLVIYDEQNRKFELDIKTITAEMNEFSVMLKVVFKRYPFLKFECKIGDCKNNPNTYVFYETNAYYPDGRIGEHPLEEIMVSFHGDIESNARASYRAFSCSPSRTAYGRIFRLNKGGLKDVASEEFYRFLYEKGPSLKVYSARDVRIIERVR